MLVKIVIDGLCYYVPLAAFTPETQWAILTNQLRAL